VTAKERGGRAAGCLTSESGRKGSSGRRSIPCANYKIIAEFGDVAEMVEQEL
jgi:hypothetical protein